MAIGKVATPVSVKLTLAGIVRLCTVEHMVQRLELIPAYRVANVITRLNVYLIVTTVPNYHEQVCCHNITNGTIVCLSRLR